MDTTRRLINNLRKQALTNRLLRNSIWLMLSTGIMGVSGFIFWAVQTHHYSPNTIGLATTLISVITLFSTLCLLGLNIAIINHIPKSKQPSSLINSATVIVIVATAIPALAFCLIAGVTSSELAFLHNDLLLVGLFVVFAVLTTVDTLMEGVFIAFKDTFFVLIKNTLISFVKVILGLFVFLGLDGLFTVYYVSLFISPLLSYPYLKKKFSYKLTAQVDVKSCKEVISSSAGNYAESIASVLPPSILPLILTTVLGPTTTAYYFIAMTIASVIYAAPKAVARNLIVELSIDTANKEKHIVHAGKILALILLPIAGVIVVFGHQILSIFGAGYSANSYILLVMLTVASMIIAINSIYWAMFNVLGESSKLLWVNASSTVIILLLSVGFLPWKLTGIGLAWILGQLAQLLFYALSSKQSYRRISVL